MKNKIIVAILIMALTLAVTGCIEIVNNGQHAGQITAIQKTGVIWKTWDVYVKTDISSSQEDKYCVEDESLIPELQKIAKDRTKVVLTYRAEAYVAPWRCENPEIITGVVPLINNSI